jgi:cytochrome b pre-mRNA-processing protein 3
MGCVSWPAGPCQSAKEASVLRIRRKRNRQEHAAYALYGAAVAAARDPHLYAALGVPDTLDGRFDSLCLHVFLLIRRLNTEGEAGKTMAQAVFDAMFHDMDINLREMGVSDLSVGKRNRAMWEAFHGRAAAYTQAWGDPAGLAAAIGRNIWRGASPPGGSAEALARIAAAQAGHLASQDAAALIGGSAHFLPAKEAAQ